MNVHDATEVAYKQGYEKGYADGVEKMSAVWIERIRGKCEFCAQLGTCEERRGSHKYCWLPMHTENEHLREVTKMVGKDTDVPATEPPCAEEVE